MTVLVGDPLLVGDLGPGPTSPPPLNLALLQVYEKHAYAHCTRYTNSRIRVAQNNEPT